MPAGTMPLKDDTAGDDKACDDEKRRALRAALCEYQTKKRHDVENSIDLAVSITLSFSFSSCSFVP